MSATILVVEDEAAIRELITVNLEMAGYTVETACSTEEAQQRIDTALPDLILLDWMLPGASGLSFARRLRQDNRSAHLPIIMLTARGSEEDTVKGLEVGADDYMTKPFSPRELTARIRAVLRRRAPQLTDDLIEHHGLCLMPGAREVRFQGRLITIGPTEYRLLHFLMSHPGWVFSRSQLLDRVWGDHVFLEERTVDVHIGRLRKALEASNKQHLIETVRGAGYRFAADGTAP